MPTNQFDTLRNIAMGNPIAQHERADIYGQKFIDKSEKWLADNQNLSPEVKLEDWMVNNRNWSFTPNNKQYYWDKVEELTPGPNEAARQSILGGVKEKLDSFTTMEDKETYYRDKAHTFPEYVHKDLEEYFYNLKGMIDRESIDKNRMNQIGAFDIMLANSTLQPNPDVSLESHTRSFVKAFDMGHENISTDDNGMVSVTVDGILTPVETLEDPTISIEEEFISQNDLLSRARESMRPRLEAERENVKQARKAADKALMNRVETDSVPDEFKANVIINGVTDAADPVYSTQAVIEKLVRTKIENGGFQKYGEATRYCYSLYRDIVNKLERRISDGASS